ncbi:MAG: serine/threonine-protein kinase [Candidatus Hydrogenedentes bacterium]|nr:serine/threonine-protein kinase [Candidatus Hydrogenedentota bacterium]
MTKIKCPVCEHTNDEGRKDCQQCGAPLPKVRVQGPGSAPKSAAPPSPQGGQATFRKGQLVANRYTIIDIVGKGGMGCIYLVNDNTLKEQVALKTLLPQYLRDKMVVDRFFNEARIARQLSHPNIVRVHDIGIADQVLYISMEYMHGKSLRNLLDELLPGERLPVKDTLKIMIDLCTALEYAHQFTVHRDLKPENVMILPDGTLKLMDFGISKLMTTGKLTATAVVMGTPHYMPPEQFRDSSAVDARADIYSIGVMLYEILTGNLPTGVPKPASQIMRDIPPALDPIVAKCVEPNPGDRYASATELKQALTGVVEILRGGTLEAKKHAASTSPLQGNARLAISGLLVAAVVALTAVGLAGLEGRRKSVISAASVVSNGTPNAVEQTRAAFNAILQLITEAEQRLLSRQETADFTRVLSRAKQLKEAAEKIEARNPGRALRLAQQALQCYVALVKPLPEDSFYFVTPGEIGADGFYFAKRPVSVREYLEWARTEAWREYGEADPSALDGPIVVNTFYDAQAFAASQAMRVSSRSEWERAFPQITEALVAEFPEWTRDVAAGAPDASGLPAFGCALVTAMVARNEDGVATEVQYGQAAYGAGAGFSFRCVAPIITNPEDVRKLLDS